MKVSPFHSEKTKTEVYHNNSKCTEGNNIKSCNKVSGTASLRLCKHCEKLNDQGK